MRHFQLLVALCVMTGCGAEMFGKDSTVLTPANMKEKVLDSDLPWIVGFYGNTPFHSLSACLSRQLTRSRLRGTNFPRRRG